MRLNAQPEDVFPMMSGGIVDKYGQWKTIDMLSGRLKCGRFDKREKKYL